MSTNEPEKTAGPPRGDDWIALAVVARPHGIRGELRVHPYNRDSELLYEVDALQLRFPPGDARSSGAVRCEAARPTQDAILLKLEGVDDRDAADALRGAQLCVQRKCFPPLEDDEFYACDIIGADVLVSPASATDSGAPAAPLGDGPAAEPARCGEVSELLTYPTVEVLVVVGDGKRWEVPFTDGYIDRIDLAGHRVWLTTLEGLEPT